MLGFTLAGVVLAAAWQNAVAIAEPAVVSMPMGRLRPRQALAKRDSSPLSVDVGNQVMYGLYYVNASVGTPPQFVQLQIDTGSSDVWMFGPGACGSQQECLGGTYDPSSSSTYKLLGKGEFEIQYVTPGSGVVGNYISDVFTLGGAQIKNLTMAVATQAQSVTTGIMGISFDLDESITEGGEYDPYPNIIDVMLAQGLIQSRSYSLYLDDLEDSTGTVLFGGYDTAKYEGDLVLLDIQPSAQTGNIDSMTVAWTGLAVTDNTGTTLLTPDDFPLPAVLDSGTTLTVIPTDLFNQLANYFGAVQDENYGNLVSCDIGNAAGSLDFGFGDGPVIQVPFVELAVPAFDTDGNPLSFEDGSAACQLGLDASPDDSIILLGDTFMRSAYVVYDLDAQQIAIAQTKFNTSDSQIEAITNSSSNPIAAASSAATGITAAQSATGLVPPGATITGFGGSGAGVPSSAGGHGSLSGVKTSLALHTFGGSGPSATGSTTGSAPASTSSKSTASVARSASWSGMYLLAGCWTAGAVLLGGMAFARVA